MHDLRLIVEELNRPPFEKDLTLVTFDEKRGRDLLQIVSDVFGELDQNHRIDLRDESPETTTYRLIDFIVVLNYRPDIDPALFQQKLADADPQVIYPLLQHVLTKMSDMKKRSYLARFLRRVEVPPELLSSDPVLPEALQQLKSLQSDFTEVHKKVEILRKTTPDPGLLQRKIDQLEHEKTQIQSRIERMTTKIDGEAQFQNVNFEQILEMTSAFRRAQEEENVLCNRLEEQERLLIQSKLRAQTLHNRFRELQMNYLGKENDESSANATLDSMRNSITGTRNMLNAHEMDIRLKQHSIDDIERILLCDPITEDQVEVLELGISSLRGEIALLEEREEEIQSQTDDKLKFFRNQSRAMKKKRQEVIENLCEIEEEIKSLDKELSELDRRMVLALGMDNRPKSDGDIKAYMRELQLKSGDYKAKKSILQILKNEVATLMRSEDILRSRDECVEELLQQLEQKKGISGFLKTQEIIEQVSSTKSRIDQEKGETLEEMSIVITNLMSQLKLRKLQLDPQIQNLKSHRLKFNEIETIYKEKKRIWDNTSIGLENERISLEEEVRHLETIISNDESRYHLVQCLQLLNRIEEGRLNHEKQLESDMNHEKRLDKVNGKYSSYRNMYELAIRRLETESRTLRKIQKDLKSTETYNLKQKEQFNRLKQLFILKLKLHSVEQSEHDAHHNFLKLESVSFHQLFDRHYADGQLN